jgi:ribonuclease-3
MTVYCYYSKGDFSVPDLVAFQETIGVSFKDISLLDQALVHSSYINENPGRTAGHNERLEFLGDAVLGWIVSEHIYQEFPDFDEGDMTKLRAALVRRETLARIARTVRLGEYLYMGKGEEASGGRNKTANLAGALEAVIAAVYRDGGADITRKFVLKLLEGEWNRAVSKGFEDDYKSILQMITQSRFQVIPVYRIVSQTGPDHDKVFTVDVSANNTVLGSGTGKSKKLAETSAARSALQRLDTEFRD